VTEQTEADHSPVASSENERLLRNLKLREALGYNYAGRMRLPPLRLLPTAGGLWSAVTPSFAGAPSPTTFRLAVDAAIKASGMSMGGGHPAL
jgi:hypothetical protein